MLFPLFHYGVTRSRVVFLAQVSALLIVLLFFAYSIALSILGVSTIAGIKHWITLNSNGATSINGIPRAVFGLARSFLHMGQDGLLFKRFLYHDPYHPISFWELFRGSLWKVVFFYLSLSGLALHLYRVKEKRKILWGVFVGAVPVVLFGIEFDGGATERYLPLFPIAVSFIALALISIKQRRFLVVILLLLTVLFSQNIYMTRQAVANEREQHYESIIQPIYYQALTPSYIVTVDLDDIIAFRRDYPFHPLSQRDRLHTLALLEIGTSQVTHWRQAFADSVITIWSKGEDVWLRTQLLEATPRKESNWAEGSDPNVQWTDLVDFFHRLEVGYPLPEESPSFVKLLPTENNKLFLHSLSNNNATLNLVQ
jgi:hypothetical protein